MQISERLRAVSDMVASGSCLADVGTDHGYIPIYLVSEGRIPKAIAMDINLGPLSRARENIETGGLSGKIETRLSNGLDALAPGEADTIIIAGMGGPLAVEILKRGREALKSCRSLILQPQSEIWNVRRYLDENEWRIQEENMILEEGKFYPMLRAGREGSEKLDQVQLFYGPRLLERRHPVLLSYLKKEREKLKEVREKLARSESSRAEDREREIRKLQNINGRALELFQEA
ncbi:MAG TPA: SAM-dependent methyltransferase [Candidatus Choladousia intestinavium]|uniref:SAM-dependent methyltransferase n=1 Tax=Candidatus Choladousia intestinavium TaxID=2840727 RepID=A0A9D1D990_9FIRM|nr:SAM-dependent methyltransferase [Candidatus Choladousia intestinavium]